MYFAFDDRVFQDDHQSLLGKVLLVGDQSEPCSGDIADDGDRLAILVREVDGGLDQQHDSRTTTAESAVRLAS